MGDAEQNIDIAVLKTEIKSVNKAISELKEMMRVHNDTHALTLKEILGQVQKTNGRVTNLEKKDEIHKRDKIWFKWAVGSIWGLLVVIVPVAVTLIKQANERDLEDVRQEIVELHQQLSKLES